MGNWFIFYVKTGSEQTACNLLNKFFSKEDCVAFIPQVKIIIKSSKIISNYLRPMFPGYVFMDSSLNERLFASLAIKYVRYSECLYKLLGSDDINCMKLSDDEKKFLSGFLNEEYVTEESKGFIVGDKVFISSGPLQGRESVIKKINRHKRRAEIELAFFGNIRRISVALEVVSKV